MGVGVEVAAGADVVGLGVVVDAGVVVGTGAFVVVVSFVVGVTVGEPVPLTAGVVEVKLEVNPFWSLFPPRVRRIASIIAATTTMPAMM